MLEWLESSFAARLVQETTWGYPIVLSLHAVGMAILAGIVLMVNFRVLGLARKVPLSALWTISRVALVGLVVNVVSGAMLFVANADAFVQSSPFWIKMSLLVAGIALFGVTSRRLRADTGISTAQQTPPALRYLAASSSLVWLGVIVMGRLIAYWDWNDV